MSSFHKQLFSQPLTAWTAKSAGWKQTCGYMLLEIFFDGGDLYQTFLKVVSIGSFLCFLSFLLFHWGIFRLCHKCLQYGLLFIYTYFTCQNLFSEVYYKETIQTSLLSIQIDKYENTERVEKRLCISNVFEWQFQHFSSVSFPLF